MKNINIIAVVLMASVSFTANAGDVELIGGSITAGNISNATVSKSGDVSIVPANVTLTAGILSGGKVPTGTATVTDRQISNVVSGNNLKSVHLNKAHITDAVVTALEWTDSSGNLVKASGPVTVSLDQAQVTNANIEKIAVQSTNSQNGSSNSSPGGFFSSAAWGMGIAYIWNNHPVISDADMGSDPSKTIHANTIQRSFPELLLTRHYYLTDKDNSCTRPFRNVGKGDDVFFSHDTCFGYFVAAGVSNAGSASQLIDMLGMGVMVGFGKVQPSKGEAADPQLRQHNIGLGIGRRFGVKQLANGFADGSPLPAGETQVRYKTVDIPVAFLMYSYTLPSF